MTASPDSARGYTRLALTLLAVIAAVFLAWKLANVALIALAAVIVAVLLRALLGCPDPTLAATGAGRGVLLRLLIGETLPVLLRDDDLVLTLSLAAPGTTKARSAG